MFKKIVFSLIFISSLMCINNVYAINLPKDNEDVKGIVSDFATDTIKEQLPKEIKKTIDEDVLPFYKKMSLWFKENILPKLKKGTDKIMTPERRQELDKEKEKIKKELPGFWEKTLNFIKTTLTKNEN